jgi:hypothetical protein
MDDLLGAIKDTPLPTVLVVAGIVFWVLAIAGSIAGKIRVQPGRQRVAGLVGTVLIVLGLLLYVAPIKQRPHSTRADAPTMTESESNKPFVDSVKIQRIGPRPETVLRQSADINLELVYSLFSAEKAILTIYLEQFPQTAAGCNGSDHQTNGSTSVPVARGEHVVSIEVHWSGGTGTGFLTVGANFWKDVDGQSVGPPTEAGLFREFCYPFGP